MCIQHKGKHSFCPSKPPVITFWTSTAGKKESQGPLSSTIDHLAQDNLFGEKTWEKAESKFQLEAVSSAIRKAGITKEELDVIFSGDLINQCIGSAYGLRDLEIPFLGL